MTTKNKVAIIIKKLFPDMKFEMFNWEKKNLGKETYQLKVHLFLWTQSLCFEFVHAVFQFTHWTPHLCMMLLKHCDTQVYLHLSKILMIIITTTHTYINTFILPNQLLHSKHLSQLVSSKKNRGAELHVMWKSLKVKNNNNNNLWSKLKGCWGDSMKETWIGWVSYNVPIHQKKLHYISSTPLLLHCG